MKRFCVIRQVAFRPSGTPRVIWAKVLSERAGVALLFVPKPDDNHLHSIVLATQNVSERLYEPMGPHRFDIHTGDAMDIGNKLRLLGKSCWAEELAKLLLEDDGLL